MNKLFLLLWSLRPKQWVKNVLIFAPSVFSLHLFHIPYLKRNLAAFFLFGLIAGCIYILNDIVDRDKDRLHPQKQRRPIASGRIQPVFAAAGGFAILSVSMVLSYFLEKNFFLIAMLYVLLNALYSLVLKEVVIIDIMIIAFGFVLRVMAGAVVNNIYMSPWILITTFLGAIFMALIKRRQELVKMQGIEGAGNTRSTLKIYTVNLLDQMISISTATTLIAYIMYVLSPDVQSKFHTDKLFYTVPFVVFGIFRYFYLSYTKGEGESPTEIIYTDLPFTLNAVLWLALFIFLVQGGV